MPIANSPPAGNSETTAGPIPADADIPWPLVDLNSDDPIRKIVDTGEFAACTSFFAGVEAAQRALMSPNSQALLFCTARNLKPENVVEIGTYQASTSEAICRALHANGAGLLHTVDPHGANSVPPILDRWPSHLQDHLRFYPVNSMAFYTQAVRSGLRPGIVFVDGDHDYECAAYDIQCAARLMQPGGFIFVDNISQPGPYFAARDFLREHPHWREDGDSMTRYRPELPFDRGRATIRGTDFCVMRAPPQVMIGTLPYTPGEREWTAPQIRGVSIPVAAPATGQLNVQCVLRIFGEPPVELTVEQSVGFTNLVGVLKIPFSSSFRQADAAFLRHAELWLTWVGEKELVLEREPDLYE
jgi:methyltransferase family protein